MKTIMKIQEKDQTLTHLTIDEEGCCCWVLCTQLKEELMGLDSQGKLDPRVNLGSIPKCLFSNSILWWAHRWGPPRRPRGGTPCQQGSEAALFANETVLEGNEFGGDG